VSRRRLRPWLAIAVLIVAGTIGASFVIETAALGGDALDGRVVGSHYYVGSRGGYTEVAQVLWILSWIHGVAAWVSFPFGLLGGWWLLTHSIFPAAMVGRAPGRASTRIGAIRASGPIAWSGSPGGVVGSVNMTIGMLGVAIYPGGVVGTPRFMTPFAIRTDEIRQIKFGRRRFISSTIEVDHEGIDVPSPIFFYGGQGSALGRALAALAEHPLDSASRDAVRSLPPVGGPPGSVPASLRATGLLGIAAAAVIALIGLLLVVPQFGLIGVLWTAFASLIALWRARQYRRYGW